MTIPHAFRHEYQKFQAQTGFDHEDPRALLMELASMSLELYIREIVWLSDFVGRVDRAAGKVA